MNFDKLLVRQDNNCLPLTSYFILLIKHRSHLLGPWVQWIPKSCSFPLLSRNWSTFAKKLSTTSSLGNCKEKGDSWSVLKCFPICWFFTKLSYDDDCDLHLHLWYMIGFCWLIHSFFISWTVRIFALYNSSVINGTPASLWPSSSTLPPPGTLSFSWTTPRLCRSSDE